MLVVSNVTDIYDKYKRRWMEQQNLNGCPAMLPKSTKNPPLWARENSCGLTPLTLAAYLGRGEMLSFLLEERKIVQWTYGNVSCVLHPLDQLDLGFQEEKVNNRLILKYSSILICDYNIHIHTSTLICLG